MAAWLRRLALIAALTAGGAAQAAEEILSYDVVVEVRADGALDVTETIRIAVEGDQIRRGIIRDFPVEYSEGDGRISLATFDVRDVRRNGVPEPHSQSRDGPRASLRIGDADVLLPVPSEQVYEIRYTTQGQLRALGDRDELYWNVTGDMWEFPIRAASVDIRLPGATPIRQHAAYTGPRGASGRDAEVIELSDGRYRARTTAPLDRREGFTVAIGWAPGAVTVLPVRYRTGGLDAPVSPLPGVLATLIGTVILALGWLRVGRDPPGGAVYPEFDPPAGLAPAAMRYVKRMGYDPGCLTAAILSMAVKGAVRIVERSETTFLGRKTYALEPLGPYRRGLSAGELAAYRKLFPYVQRLDLTGDRINGARVDQARAALKSMLWDEHYGASFRRNGLYTLGGVALGAIVFVAVAIASGWGGGAMLQWALPALGAGLLTHGIGFLWVRISDFGQGIGFVVRRVLRLVPFLAFAGVFGFTFFTEPGLRTSLALASPGIAVAGAAFGLVAGLFHFLMAAPSKAGRVLMDRIEGFEMYLRTAEEDRLEILNPPEHTPELFERLLPYAVALGVSHQWAAKFAGVLANAAAPTWYAGSGRFDVDGFGRDFGHAVSSATAPPSRGSGGSGGGGFSGGGGGGGGGRGW